MTLIETCIYQLCVMVVMSGVLYWFFIIQESIKLESRKSEKLIRLAQVLDIFERDCEMQKGVVWDCSKGILRRIVGKERHQKISRMLDQVFSVEQHVCDQKNEIKVVRLSLTLGTHLGHEIFTRIGICY